MDTLNSRMINFINKNDLLLTSLRKYYSKDSNFTQLENILKNEAKISLRIIDWFATNYSKKYNIIYEICADKKKKFYLKNDEKCDNVLKQFIVYMNYKSQLKAYSKKQFDPFCRRERIEFQVKKRKIITTIGQLNFFKWAIENQIIEYINDNLENIENDMNSSISNNSLKKTRTKKSKTRKKKLSPKKKINKNDMSYKDAKVSHKKRTKRKKRNELSVSASRGLNKHNVRVVLEFN